MDDMDRPDEMSLHQRAQKIIRDALALAREAQETAGRSPEGRHWALAVTSLEDGLMRAILAERPGLVAAPR